MTAGMDLGAALGTGRTSTRGGRATTAAAAADAGAFGALFDSALAAGTVSGTARPGGSPAGSSDAESSVPGAGPATTLTPAAGAPDSSGQPADSSTNGAPEQDMADARAALGAVWAGLAMPSSTPPVPVAGAVPAAAPASGAEPAPAAAAITATPATDVAAPFAAVALPLPSLPAGAGLLATVPGGTPAAAIPLAVATVRAVPVAATPGTAAAATPVTAAAATPGATAAAPAATAAAPAATAVVAGATAAATPGATAVVAGATAAATPGATAAAPAAAQTAPTGNTKAAPIAPNNPVPVAASHAGDARTAGQRDVTVSADTSSAAGTGAAAALPSGPANLPATTAASATPQPAAAAPQHGTALQPQLSRPLFTMATSTAGEHVMTLQVSPEDLGPVTIRAHIDAAGVRIEMFAPGETGREALRGVLPELRKELSDAGFGASLNLSDRNGPGDTGANNPGGSGAWAGRDNGDRGRQGYFGSPGDRRNGTHRDDGGEPARDADRTLNGPSTNLDILV